MGAAMNDLVRLRRRHAMFLKAIREMEESEAEHRRSAGEAYAEPQTLRWARLDLATIEEELTRLGGESDR
jgi:hypothetical protein